MRGRAASLEVALSSFSIHFCPPSGPNCSPKMRFKLVLMKQKRVGMAGPVKFKAHKDGSSCSMFLSLSSLTKP